MNYLNEMNSHYIRYYLKQSGGSLSDIGEIYKSPLIYQRGSGIGSFFSALFRRLKPVVTTLAQQAVKTGQAIIQDKNINNKSIKDILKEHGRVAVQDLAQKGINKVFDNMGGAGIKRPNPFTTFHILKSTAKRKRRCKTPKRTSRTRRNKRTTTIQRRKQGLRRRILDIFDK